MHSSTRNLCLLFTLLASSAQAGERATNGEVSVWDNSISSGVSGVFSTTQAAPGDKAIFNCAIHYRRGVRRLADGTRTTAYTEDHDVYERDEHIVQCTAMDQHGDYFSCASDNPLLIRAVRSMGSHDRLTLTRSAFMTVGPYALHGEYPCREFTLEKGSSHGIQSCCVDCDGSAPADEEEMTFELPFTESYDDKEVLLPLELEEVVP